MSSAGMSGGFADYADHRQTKGAIAVIGTLRAHFQHSRYVIDDDEVVVINPMRLVCTSARHAS